MIAPLVQAEELPADTVAVPNLAPDVSCTLEPRSGSSTGAGRDPYTGGIWFVVATSGERGSVGFQFNPSCGEAALGTSAASPMVAPGVSCTVEPRSGSSTGAGRDPYTGGIWFVVATSGESGSVGFQLNPSCGEALKDFQADL